MNCFCLDEILKGKLLRSALRGDSTTPGRRHPREIVRAARPVPSPEPQRLETRESSVDCCCLSVRRSYEFRASLSVSLSARSRVAPTARARAPSGLRLGPHAKIPQRKPTSAQLWPSETRFAVGHANTVLVSLRLHDFALHSFIPRMAWGRTRLARRGESDSSLDCGSLVDH